jgi:hypothetical protein
MWSTGVLGDVAADHAGTTGRRIGGIVETLRLDGFVQRLRDDARLGHRHEIVRVDLEDGVHALEGQREAAGEGKRAARQAGASSLRRHGDPTLVAIGKQPRDLEGRPRLRRRRRIVDEVLRPVVRVRLEVVLRDQEMPLPHDRGERGKLGGGKLPALHGRRS